MSEGAVADPRRRERVQLDEACGRHGREVRMISKTPPDERERSEIRESERIGKCFDAYLIYLASPPTPTKAPPFFLFTIVTLS